MELIQAMHLECHLKGLLGGDFNYYYNASEIKQRTFYNLT